MNKKQHKNNKIGLLIIPTMWELYDSMNDKLSEHVTTEKL